MIAAGATSARWQDLPGRYLNSEVPESLAHRALGNNELVEEERMGHDDPTEPLTAVGTRSPRRDRPRDHDAARTAERSVHVHAHGHGHGHSDEPVPAASPAVRRLLVGLLVPLAVAALAGVVLLYPWSEDSVESRFETGTPVHGTILSTSEGACPRSGEVRVGPPEPGTQRCLTLRIRLTDGPGRDSIVGKLVPIQPGIPRFAVGDDLVLSYSTGAPTSGQAYRIMDFQRGASLGVLAALFAIVVVGFARMQGLRALISLGLSFAVLAAFVLPAILAGRDPLPVAIVGAGLIMFMALYFTHGFSARTSVAVLGTLVSLGLIGGLATAATALTHLSGLDPETADLITALGHGIDTHGLLLAGILLGALGVLDDVTTTQASAVWELRHANPRWGRRQLYTSAMRIGRSHATSAVNTLFMAYAGAALPLLLYTAISGIDLDVILTSKTIAQEIVRTIAGSLGLIASIPATTLLAALITTHQHRPTPPQGTRSHTRARRTRARA